MAIAFARMEIVSAKSGGSAVMLSSYLSRDARVNEQTGERYHFGHRKDELEHSEVMLPEGASAKFHDPQVLWNAAERADMTIDRKTKEHRFKTGAQLAKHMVLALPDNPEISNEDRIEMTRRFVKEQFVDKGVAVEFAVHKPDDHNQNWHAHVLISTRRLTEDGFGKKAADLNPVFGGRGFVAVDDQWGEKWGQHQDRYFEELGLDLRVDSTRLVGGEHLGPARFQQDADKVETNNERTADARDLAHDPDHLLGKLTERKSYFSERDIDRLLHKNGIYGEEVEFIKEKVFAHKDLLRLYEPDAEKPTAFYTTRQVREQELRVSENTQHVAARSHAVTPGAVHLAVSKRTMDPEQLAAFEWATKANGFAMIEGIAGSGKSYSVSAIREAYEESGYDVRGLAPTNSVVADMRKDGFRKASTLHMELLRLENNRTTWTPKTVVIVDEAAMVDTKIFDRLMHQANHAGAKMILVGDDRQLASVERGGMFTQLKKEHGSALISEVRRQSDDWAKKASQDFANGRIRNGLKAYADHGNIHWKDSLDESRQELAEQWSKDSAARPNVNRFVYASTNAQVDALNKELRAIKLARGKLKNDGITFATKRGKVEFTEGDRIQFYGNDRKNGIVNGTVGTIQRLHDGSIMAKMDDGKVVSFDPSKFQDFGHGYAGTVYRGQGKTQTEVYALYDNPYAWNARTAYVGMTRQKEIVQLYVPKELASDLDKLARQMGRRQEAGSSLDFQAKHEPISLTERQLAMLAQKGEQLSEFWNRTRTAITEKVTEVRSDLTSAASSLRQRVDRSRLGSLLNRQKPDQAANMAPADQFLKAVEAEQKARREAKETNLPHLREAALKAGTDTDQAFRQWSKLDPLAAYQTAEAEAHRANKEKISALGGGRDKIDPSLTAYHKRWQGLQSEAAKEIRSRPDLLQQIKQINPSMARQLDQSAKLAIQKAKGHSY